MVKPQFEASERSSSLGALRVRFDLNCFHKPAFGRSQLILLEVEHSQVVHREEVHVVQYNCLLVALDSGDRHAGSSRHSFVVPQLGLLHVCVHLCQLLLDKPLVSVQHDLLYSFEPVGAVVLPYCLD